MRHLASSTCYEPESTANLFWPHKPYFIGYDFIYHNHITSAIQMISEVLISTITTRRVWKQGSSIMALKKLQFQQSHFMKLSTEVNFVPDIFHKTTVKTQAASEHQKMQVHSYHLSFMFLFWGCQYADHPLLGEICFQDSMIFSTLMRIIVSWGKIYKS